MKQLGAEVLPGPLVAAAEKTRTPTICLEALGLAAVEEVHGQDCGCPGSLAKRKVKFLGLRLARMQRVLDGREWLAGSFSIADILMADVLRRLVDRFDGLADYPACRDYVARATARPAFVKAHAEQMAHFAAGD